MRESKITQKEIPFSAAQARLSYNNGNIPTKNIAYMIVEKVCNEKIRQISSLQEFICINVQHEFESLKVNGRYEFIIDELVDMTIKEFTNLGYKIQKVNRERITVYW